MVPANSKECSSEPEQETVKWRPVLYKLAATGFSHPQKAFIEEVKSGKFFAGMEEISCQFHLGLEDAIEDVEKAVTDEDSCNLLEELESEYVSLFLADVGGARVNPFGSHYLDGRVMGESVDKVVSRYGEAGMVKQESYHGQPDHIAVELEYLYKLTQASQNSSSCKKNLSRHRDFYDELLRPWLGEFTEDVRTETDLEFYSLLAEWVHHGLEADRKVIEKTLENEHVSGVSAKKKNDQGVAEPK